MNEWKFIRAHSVTQVVKKHKKVYHTSLQPITIVQDHDKRSECANSGDQFVWQITQIAMWIKLHYWIPGSD